MDPCCSRKTSNPPKYIHIRIPSPNIKQAPPKKRQGWVRGFTDTSGYLEPKTVDGFLNPAPVDQWFLPPFNQFFFKPSFRWCRISQPSTVEWRSLTWTDNGIFTGDYWNIMSIGLYTVSPYHHSVYIKITIQSPNKINKDWLYIVFVPVLGPVFQLDVAVWIPHSQVASVEDLRRCQTSATRAWPTMRWRCHGTYMFPVPGSPAPPPMVWSPKNPSLPAACHVSICLVTLSVPKLESKPTTYRHTTPQGGGGK